MLVYTTVMPKILIRIPGMSFIASAQAPMVEPVVMTSSNNKTCLFFNIGIAGVKDALYVFMPFESLFAGLAFGPFDA